jgi:hyperosmotically inducible protein
MSVEAPSLTFAMDQLMKKLTVTRWLVMPALMLSSHVFAQDNAAAPKMTRTAEVAAPDNSKSNKLESSNRAATADKAKNDATDLDLAKRVRQNVTADKSLSTYGHNVKIVAVDGTVTLNGVVRSANEKTQIAKTAAAIAGADHVVDDLKVAPEK